jgi:hypothetical protein
MLKLLDKKDMIKSKTLLCAHVRIQYEFDSVRCLAIEQGAYCNLSHGTCVGCADNTETPFCVDNSGVFVPRAFDPAAPVPAPVAPVAPAPERKTCDGCRYVAWIKRSDKGHDFWCRAPVSFCKFAAEQREISLRGMGQERLF